jgi:thermitase
MRRLLHALLAFLIIALFLLPQAAAGPRSRSPKQPPVLGPYTPDEVLVKFRPGINADVAAGAVGARVKERISALDIHVLRVPAGTVEATLRSFSRNALVEFAEPNGYVRAFVIPNDPCVNAASCPHPTSDGSPPGQWYWAKVSAYAAWDLVNENCTNVAVVDTGIDVGDPTDPFAPDTSPHPDLHEPTCPATLVRSYVSGENGNDDHGHGTHIAGVIGARTDNGTGIAGASWRTRLIGVKVLNWYGSGTWSQVASGIRYAADNGAKVINLSLGGASGSRTLQSAVNYAWNRGAVLVCAAGNDGTTARSYPAYYPNCLAVAASDQNDNRPSWSTYGSWVEVAAPGDTIFSTMQDDFNWCSLCWLYGYYEGYDTLSGTSMATSVVSGLAALVWASGLCTNNSCVRNRIQSTADPVSGGWVVYGRVNFQKAVTPP